MKRLGPWKWVPSLYFTEGLPFVAVMNISLIFYKQLGLSNEDITYYTSWLYLPWAIKWLWSPLVDRLKAKRWWIVTMQILIGAALGGVAFTIPTAFWLQGTLFFFWIMAFASATHDVAADGFYMVGLNAHQQAWFVGIRSLFYRLATIFGQGTLISIAGNLQVIFRNQIAYTWSLVFYGMAALLLVLWLWHKNVLPHPQEHDDARPDFREMVYHFQETVVMFFKKPQVIAGILFMLFYRMPEGLLAKVAALFLVDSMKVGGLGLTPQEYGLIQGTLGVIGLSLGGILGGMAAAKHGLKPWLWTMVCAITLPDAVYIYMSYTLPDNLWIIGTCVFVEQFGYGFGFTAYMLYLIYYSRGEHQTEHYAMCTGIMALSMLLPGQISGSLQESMGYQNFFLLVMGCCAITFIVTSRIKLEPGFGKKETVQE